MPSKKHRKSPQQLEYERQLKNLRRRTKTWSKKYHYEYPNTYAKRPYESYSKAAERLKKIRYSNLTEKQKQQYHEEWINKYENNDYTDAIDNLPDYTPPTENDYYDSYNPNEYYEPNDDEDEPANTEEEYSQYVDDLISTILSEDSMIRSEEMRQKFRNMLDSLRNQLGDKGFFDYMLDGDRVNRMQNIAYEGMIAYNAKDGGLSQRQQYALTEFATECNGGKPISDDQAFELSIYGTTKFDLYDEELL